MKEPLWKVGDRVEFATFDDDDADTRELDGTTATVLMVDPTYGQVLVNCAYGERWFDEYSFIERGRR